MACEHWKHLAGEANRKMLAMERERKELRAQVEALLEQAKRERDGLPRVLMRDDPYGYGNGMHAGGKVAGIAEVLYVLLDGADG